MASLQTLSITEKLVLAAYDLEQSGKRPFSAEDLVVAAWKKFPDAFGLAGYQNQTGEPIYPDSNRVFAEIMGSKSIRKKGFLEKVGTKMYQLTVAGQDYARFLSTKSVKTTTKKAALGREIEHELKRLFDAKAWEKFKKGKVDEITFYDACGFWGISPRSSAIEYEGKIANFAKIIETSRKTVQGDKATFEHSGYTFGKKEIEDLFQIHETLLSKFNEEIKIIKTRTDERA